MPARLREEIMRDPGHPTCPTCGLPVSVYLLAAPERLCPNCRDAWKAMLAHTRDVDVDPDRRRTIRDLI
jgi:hypothetical protein